MENVHTIKPVGLRTAAYKLSRTAVFTKRTSRLLFISIVWVLTDPLLLTQEVPE